jgi:hypothetical protein
MKGSGVPAIFLAVLLCSSMASAGPLKSWGFKGGYTAAQQIWQHERISQDEISWRSGIHLGAYAEWFDYEFHASADWSHHLSMTTGLNYEQKGMKWTVATATIYDPTPRNMTIDFYSDYLSIPLMVKYCVRGARVAPYLHVGPRLDISLGPKNELGPEDEYGDTVFGLSAGAGLEISRLGLFFEVVYNYDQAWLWETTNALTGNEIRVRNESFNVSIGHRIKL